MNAKRVINDKNMKYKSINSKRILLLAPAFFGYEKRIQKKMEEMGAIVDLYDERSVTSELDKAFLKVNPNFFAGKTEAYYNSIIDKHRDVQYDFIFIVKCEMITEPILKKLRTTYPNAVFCLYLWDSVKNIKGITAKFKYFDRILSFDSCDVKEYPIMKFRPLYYADEFKKELKKADIYKYDISFCGTIHSDRYSIIKEVLKYCNKYKLTYKTFCYLQSNFIYYFHRITKPEFCSTSISDFSFEKKSGSDIATIVDESKVILDIQHPNQTGLTQRTIEMIGMNKKLITTNVDIMNYDFYNPNNILVIPRKGFIIPIEFFKSKYEPLSDEIYKKYSIESWINDILYEIEEV